MKKDDYLYVKVSKAFKEILKENYNNYKYIDNLYKEVVFKKKIN